jgi:uncharacterized phiE125 gp8 family phage protein
MTTVKITDAATEPLTLAEAKAHCKVTHDEEDALITSLIVAVRKACEQQTGRTLITTTWECVLDSFPEAVRLDFPKILSVVSVKYIDESGIEQTLSPSDYKVDTDSVPGYVVPAYGKAWPATRDEINAVRVRYTAGYGAAAAVPENLKQWMKLQIGHFYLNREATAAGAEVSVLPYVDHLLDSELIYAL